MTTMTPKMRRAHEIFASIGYGDDATRDQQGELDRISEDLWVQIGYLADSIPEDSAQTDDQREIVRELTKIAARLDDFDLNAERVA